MTTGKHTYLWSLVLIGSAMFWPSSVPAERLVAVLQALPGLTA
jgi:hypothetical protein